MRNFMARNGGVRGDYVKLARLITAAAQAAEKRLLRSAARRMGDATLKLATSGAAAGKAPSGRRWKPLKSHSTAVSNALGQSAAFAMSGNFGAAASMSKMASDLASGGAMPLARASGTLRLRAYDGSFVVSSSRLHLAFHNKGAKRRGTNWVLPKRTILPRRALPKKWRPAIERAGMSAFRAMFGRRI